MVKGTAKARHRVQKKSRVEQKRMYRLKLPVTECCHTFYAYDRTGTRIEPLLFFEHPMLYLPPNQWLHLSGERV